jgi:DNA-binding MarR family transcriptional regulator
MNSANTGKPEIVTEPISASDIPQLGYIELLFFAYRDFTADADRILARLGFGRAHHRVLYFVNREPGMTVAELLAILGITKQSLSRVLRQLIESGHVCQVEGQSDRRKRLLYPTTAGRDLILALSWPQSRRIDSALGSSGLPDDRPISQFLRAMMNRPGTTESGRTERDGNGAAAGASGGAAHGAKVEHGG